MMTIKKLSAHPYAQAHVEIHPNGYIALFSYQTLVAGIHNGEWLTVYGLYSTTTRRHISAFCKEYCDGVSYQTAKFICENYLQLNINTGEVQDLFDEKTE